MPTVLKLKRGVSLRGLQPPMVIALLTAHGIWSRRGHSELTVTSATDGQHMAGSLHYVGLGIDLRYPSPSSGPRLVSDLYDALGEEFDVIDAGTHIHVEFQPDRQINDLATDPLLT